MGAPVSITRLSLTASELRKAASGEKKSAAARRILAFALVLDGVDRKMAADLRHGPSDLARLGVPLQRCGTGGTSQSQIAGVPDRNSRGGSRPHWLSC